ncbi:hypothetical protein PISMIDRAFT_112783, partial [Pisolithus microcarpus 441]
MIEQTANNTHLTRIHIWQQNLNKSNMALFSLLNGTPADNWDIIALQEPPINAVGNTKANSQWRVVYP